MKLSMKAWGGNCHRCWKRSTTSTMSKFNTDCICMECDDEERRHPDYAAAVQADNEAVRNGDHNFPGIGWPRPSQEPPKDEGPFRF